MEAAPAALAAGEAADLCDLSCSSAALHAPKRCRDVEDAGEDKSSESQHGGPSMKRSGSLRDLGMAPSMSGLPMTRSGLSGGLDDMGISSRSDSPSVHARRVGQGHELATVPGSPAAAPTGDGPMMPKINSVLSIPSDSPSHTENRATRTLSEEATAEVTLSADRRHALTRSPHPDPDPDPDLRRDRALPLVPSLGPHPHPHPSPEPQPG